MAGRIRREAPMPIGVFGRQCVSVVLVAALLAQPLWAGPPAPELTSRSGAAYTLYLDFSGFTWDNVTATAYGADADFTTFSATELARIHEIWSRVSDHFSAFDVNVTTVDPAAPGGTDAERQAFYDSQARFMHTVLGETNDLNVGGVSGVGTARTPQQPGFKTNWVVTNKIGGTTKNAGVVTAHENGHALGLYHQGDWHNGAEVRAYSEGTGTGPGSVGPTMGNTYLPERHLWSKGYNGQSANNVVNEVSIFTNGTNPMTIVNDGVGRSLGEATTLPVFDGKVDFEVAKGVIVPTGSFSPTSASDYTAGYWQFTTSGGDVSFTANSGRSSITLGQADPGGTLDAAIEILDMNGIPIPGGGNTTYVAGQYSATVSANLAAGTYAIRVTNTRGPGNAGLVDNSYSTPREFFDIGSYFLTGTVPAASTGSRRYWDNNGSGGGFGTANGTWSATTTGNGAQGWSGDDTGGTTPVDTSVATADRVHFGSETSGLAAGTVNVSGTVTANRITFGKASGAMTLDGGTITLAGTTPTVTVNNSSATINSALAGSAGLTKAGTGTLVLTGNNTYTGLTTINAGTLDISGTSGSSFAVDSIAGLVGSSLALGAKNFVVGGDNSSSTFGSRVVTTGSFEKVGTGTLTLTGTNHVSGPTTVTAGTLALSGLGQLSNTSLLTISSGGVFDITRVASNAAVEAIAGGSGSSIALGSNKLTVGNTGASMTFGGVISGSGGSLTKAGDGTLTLTGANTYTGSTTITSGTLALAGTGSLSNAGVPSLTLSTAGATLDISGLSGAGTSIRNIGGASGSFIELGSKTLTAVNQYGTTLAATIKGSGALTKSSGTLTLTGVNTYTGATTISAATLVLSGAGALSDVTAVNLSGGNPQLTISGISASSETVGSIAGTSSSTINLGGKNLTAGGNDGNTTFAGVISGTGGSFTKTGAGTLTLNGTNSYTGATTISGGTLSLGSAGSLASSLIDVEDGGTFNVTALAGGFTLASGRTLAGAGTVMGNLSFAEVSFFDISGALASNPLDREWLTANGTITFNGSFGVESLLGIDWNTIASDTYTLIGTTQTDWGSLANFGEDNAYFHSGSGKSAYFESGSLKLVVVPEPSTGAIVGVLAALGFMARRRRRPARRSVDRH